MQVLFPPRAGVEREGHGADIKTPHTFCRLHVNQRSVSPALQVWLRTATKEPNPLTGMSLPLLENKIKNRERVLLLNVTQAGWKGSSLLAEYSRKKCSISVAGQDKGGRWGAGAWPLQSRP